MKNDKDLDVGYFKLQAKNLFHDFKLDFMQDDSSYVCAPRFYDVNAVVTDFGIDDYAALESKVAEISAANDEAAAALKAVERRLSDMAVLIKNISTYRQTRPVALEYRKAKDKAAYRREHESQLILYEAAAKAIKDAGVTKLPNLAALKAEYRKLDEEKERLYQKYGEVKKELADYGIIKQNVDSILRVTPHQERTQEL